MKPKIIVLFIRLAGFLLLLTAAAKLGSITGTARILNNLDPVFHISFRHLLGMTALVELGVVAVCFGVKNQILQAGLIAALATNFILYRLGLYWQGYGSACPCLGNLTDALHIPPHIADAAMKIILAYLFLGSYGTLFWVWRQKRRPISASVPSGTSVPSPAPTGAIPL
jgi:hypothetical protein